MVDIQFTTSILFTLFMKVADFNFLPLVLVLMMSRWFAKRFLHPDIVEEYNYVFLWDEDLGVDNFNPKL